MAARKPRGLPRATGTPVGLETHVPASRRTPRGTRVVLTAGHAADVDPGATARPVRRSRPKRRRSR